MQCTIASWCSVVPQADVLWHPDPEAASGQALMHNASLVFGDGHVFRVQQCDKQPCSCSQAVSEAQVSDVSSGQAQKCLLLLLSCLDDPP